MITTAAAERLARACEAECPVRLSWLDHLDGLCRHVVPPDGGRIGSLQGKTEAPAGWLPTMAQGRLDALLAARKEENRE